MSGIKKISKAVEHRRLTPLMEYIREKMIRVRRVGSGRGDRYLPNNRWPDTQIARDLPPPNLPGGVHHRIEGNYYFLRDGRREVVPPKVLYDTDKLHLAAAPGTETPQVKAVSKGPEENFGLSAPTPGFGAIWKRNSVDELAHIRKDKNFKMLENYDRYTQPKREKQ